MLTKLKNHGKANINKPCLQETNLRVHLIILYYGAKISTEETEAKAQLATHKTNLKVDVLREEAMRLNKIFQVISSILLIKYQRAKMTFKEHKEILLLIDIQCEKITNSKKTENRKNLKYSEVSGISEKVSNPRKVTPNLTKLKALVVQNLRTLCVML